MEATNSKQTNSIAGKANSCKNGVASFLVGIIMSVILGWWIFPQILFIEKPQPLQFSHKIHNDTAVCVDCHSFRPDGSFTGIPNTQKCSECHTDTIGMDPAEKILVENYVKPNIKIPWKIYQKQPDNVFFSHAVHNMKKCGECHQFTEPEICTKCHLNMADSDTPPPYIQNWITKYSTHTMKMWQCEHCHAQSDHTGNTAANNACFTCHK
ncbi:Menaquinone reductase, multiheme cytochrome c subunit [Desulfovibrionales bacterium]